MCPRLVPGFQEILNVLDNTARVSGRICDETSTQLFLDRTGFYGLYRYVGTMACEIRTSPSAIAFQSQHL